MPRKALISTICTFGVWVAEGVLDYPTPGLLNDRFPEIETVQVQELIEKGWGN